MSRLPRLVLPPVVLALLAVLAIAADKPAATQALPKDVPAYLQSVAVTIRAGNAQGSGVFKVTKDGQVWVWTAGHVVDGLRRTRETIKDGGKKTVVEFDDPQVVQVETEAGRKVGESVLDAEVIRYSDADHGEDLALLRLRTKRFKPAASAVFYLDEQIPPIGSDLYHCGSRLGQFGSNGLTGGLISQHGRLYQGKVYDELTCPIMPGSSGGIVCLRDGRYVGMVVRGAGETFGLMVPVRRMRAWAKRVGVEFAMDDVLPVPDEAKLKAGPVEESGEASGPHTHAHNASAFRFMIRQK